MKGQMIAWNGRRGGLFLFLSIEKGVVMGEKCEFLFLSPLRKGTLHCMDWDLGTFLAFL